MEPKQTHTEPCTRNLRVELTPEEVRAASKAQARADNEARQIEANKKSAADHWKAEAQRVDAEMRLLSRLVLDECDWRDVACEETYDYSAGTVTIVRLDTGEIVGTRPMLDEERQGKMPL